MLDDVGVEGELDTVVHGLTYVGSVAAHTGCRRKRYALQQVGGEHVVVLEGTVQAVVEECEVDTEVPGLRELPAKVAVRKLRYIVSVDHVATHIYVRCAQTSEG